MNNQFRNFYIIATSVLLLAVVFGAFGAHAFQEILVRYDRSSTFALANDYHFFHGLGLLAITIIAQINPSHPFIHSAFYCMFFGLIVFSLSLYVLALTNFAWLGAVTPFGGILLLIGWFLMLYGFIRMK